MTRLWSYNSELQFQLQPLKFFQHSYCKHLCCWPVFVRPFVLFAPLCWPPLFLTFLGTFSSFLPPQKVICSVEQGAQHRAWRGAVSGWTSPQSSGRNFPKSAWKRLGRLSSMTLNALSSCCSSIHRSSMSHWPTIPQDQWLVVLRLTQRVAATKVGVGKCEQGQTHAEMARWQLQSNLFLFEGGALGAEREIRLKTLLFLGNVMTIESIESKCHLRVVMFWRVPSARKKRNPLPTRGFQGALQKNDTCLTLYCCTWGHCTSVFFVQARSEFPEGTPRYTWNCLP